MDIALRAAVAGPVTALSLLPAAALPAPPPGGGGEEAIEGATERILVIPALQQRGRQDGVERIAVAEVETARRGGGVEQLAGRDTHPLAAKELGEAAQRVVHVTGPA